MAGMRKSQSTTRQRPWLIMSRARSGSVVPSASQPRRSRLALSISTKEVSSSKMHTGTRSRVGTTECSFAGVSLVAVVVFMPGNYGTADAKMAARWSVPISEENLSAAGWARVGQSEEISEFRGVLRRRGVHPFPANPELSVLRWEKQRVGQSHFGAIQQDSCFILEPATGSFSRRPDA